MASLANDELAILYYLVSDCGCSPIILVPEKY